MTFRDKFLEELKNAKLLFSNLKKGDNKNLFSKLKANKLVSFGILAIIIIIIGGTIFFISSGKSKEEIINNCVMALKEQNINKLEKILVLPNGDELTTEQLEPIMNFYKADSSRITSLKDSLEKSVDNYPLKVIKENGFLRDDSVIEVSYKEVNLTTNLKNVNIMINGIQSGVVDGSKKIELIAPGQYNITLESKNEFSTIRNSKDISLVKNTDLDIPLNGVNISINCNIPTANIYVNGADTGIIADDFKNIGPFPTDGSVEIYAKYKTPFGYVASEITKITDIPEINLEVNLKNSQLKAILNNTVGKFFASVFSAIDVKDSSKISPATKEAAEKVYSYIKQNSFILQNIYKLNSSSIDFDKSTITFENGEYSANIVTNIDYNVKKAILGVPLKSTNYNQNFFIKLKYINDSWQVYDTEKFSLNTV